LIEADVRPLNVLISGHEICGLIHDFAEELDARGHHVTTIAMPHRFFPHDYDYDQYRLAESVLSSRYGAPRAWSVALGQLWKAAPKQHEQLEKRLRVDLARSSDLYIRVWGNIPFDEEVLRAIDDSNVRVASFLMGSDVRDHSVFAQQYSVSEWEFPDEYQTPPLASKLKTLRVHERFADAIFSVPDQMGLALRPYHHLQVPLRLEQFEYRVPGREIPRVVHAPSAPHVKGTDLIERALGRLKEEGVQFEFVSIREMTHEGVLRTLTDADVLVDELILHGPGWLSFEAMASGCAVATKHLVDSPACFRPPIWAIDQDNLVERLRELLTNVDLRNRLATEGRKYVEQNNIISRVMDSILKKTQQGSEATTDYEPGFLLNSFEPRNFDEVQLINSANALVSSESWYEERIAGVTRMGLTF
jgi:glycosyltransferase involved in cell wall biosynthesis